MAQSFDLKTAFIWFLSFSLQLYLIFLSNRSIAAGVDGHCFSPKSVNSDVPQTSILLLTLCLLFINDLNQTFCLSIPTLMIPPYTFPLLPRDDQPFKKLTDPAEMPHISD